MAIVISADEIKKTLSGYKPERSGDFHQESAKIADREYAQAVKTAKDTKTVILLSGGSASGKTEYLSGYLQDTESIIVDGTLSTIEGFKIKYRKAQKNKKDVEVHSVIPHSLRDAFTAFLGRKRQYDAKHFYSTHSRSRSTLLRVAKDFQQVSITIITSYFIENKKMGFKVLEYKTRQDLIEYLETIQYTEEEVIKEIS